MNVRVDLNYPIKDGTEVVFRSPVDCSQVTGLKVYYPGEDGNTTSREFAFADAHGNNVGDIDHLFAENVVVKVILDVTSGMAFVQNADTNAYLEGRFAEVLPKTELEVAVNAALAQAKASGEFDGPDGFSPIATVEQTDSGAVISITDKNGTTTATVTNGKDGKDGNDAVSPTVAVSKSGKVTTVSITDKDGTKTATINDGADGYTPVKDKDYFDGKDGTSVTVKNVSESSADGGSNVVTFSDGKTLNVKNGQTGGPGKTPVRGTDYWTEADQEAIVQQVVTVMGMHIVGVIGTNKVITLSGKLPADTYTFVFENEDGTVTEIGTKEIGNQMPTAGSIEITWADGVKLDKNTGAEGSGDGYAASQHIELVDGYTYTFNQLDDGYGSTYGGANICYYDADGKGLGYELLWDATGGAFSKALTPIAGAKTFRVRLYWGTGGANNAHLFTVTYEKTA